MKTKEEFLQAAYGYKFEEDDFLNPAIRITLNAMEKYAQEVVNNLHKANRTFSADDVKVLLEKQKQLCANEFIHAEMTMEQAKRRVLNAPIVSF
jgi:spore coat polysaccharide biosynthesis protein SpsF (cytidylyltransferase family)